MKNVTISMDEELAQAVRVEAAKDGKSVSRYLSELVRERIASAGRPPAPSKRNAQQAALARILAGPLWEVSENGRMPSAEERNARR